MLTYNTLTLTVILYSFGTIKSIFFSILQQAVWAQSFLCLQHPSPHLKYIFLNQVDFSAFSFEEWMSALQKSFTNYTNELLTEWLNEDCKYFWFWSSIRISIFSPPAQWPPPATKIEWESWNSFFGFDNYDADDYDGDNDHDYDANKQLVVTKWMVKLFLPDYYHDYHQ